MKKLIYGVLMFVIYTCMVNITVTYADENNKGESLVIGVLSDTHYYSKELMSDCEDLDKEIKEARNIFLEGEAVVDAAFNILLDNTPDVLFVTGDMSRDGEKKNEEIFAKKLEKLREKSKEKGKELKIYVINGNHDINYPKGVDFSAGKREKAEQTTTKDFREIYKNMGYDSNSEFYSTEENTGGCLSYATKLADGFTLIAVDSCKYSSDQTKRKKDEGETDGIIFDKLLEWVSNKAKSAKTKGDKVIVIQHHGIVPHFNKQEVYKYNYLVNNYKETSEVYADSGIDMVFTGHMHANDIVKYTSKKGNTLYDIETGPLMMFPCPIRVVTLTKGEGIDVNADIKTEFVREIDYIDEETGEKITDLYEYSKKYVFNKDKIKPMIMNVVLPELENIEKNGGIKKYLSTILKIDEDKFNKVVVKMLREKLPQDKENAIKTNIWKFKFDLYYDKNADKICINEASSNKIKPIKIYIDMDKIENKILDDIYTDIDDLLTNDIEEIEDTFGTFIDTALEYKIDNNHTLVDFLHEVYMPHLSGEEKCPEWVEKFIEKMKNKHTLGNIFKCTMKKTNKKLIKLISKIDIKTKDIIGKGNNGIKTKLIYNIIVMKFKSLESIVEFILKKNILYNMVAENISKGAYEISYNLNHDDNYQEDNNTNILLNTIY